MAMRIALLSILFLLFVFSIRGQEFGGHPPSQKWKQINTDTVRVIFPAGLDSQATEITRIAHQLARETQNTIGNRVRKINIVLQNQTTVSNAYVGLQPYRSEFQLTPMQNSFELGSIPWHATLALHEYRHVQQFNNFRKGISKAFFYLFGEGGLALANNTAIPNWFWEGDAVFQETLASKQGRGRLPYFFNGYRSLWASNKNYSWMKLRNGSLRDYTPDHYQLGYLMVAYGREKYGEEIWKNVTDDAARFRGLFYPLQKAINKHTGVNYTAFRKDAIQYFNEQASQNKDEASDYAQQQKHFAGDEEFPQWIDSSSVVFVKSSYKKNPAFYIRNMVSGADEKLRAKDISLNTYFSYRNGRIVYAAYEPDIRWGWKDYSVIKLIKVNSGKQTNVTNRTKYFSPDISMDGKKIVAVNVLPGGENELHILNSESGNVETTIPNKERWFITYPKFYDDNTVVAAVRNNKAEMALVLINIANGSTETLIPFSMNVIGFPVVQNNIISFTASHENRDKLFAIIQGKVYEFKPSAQRNTATGNYHLSVLGNNYAWTAFTAAGYHLMVEKNNSAALTEISPQEITAALSDNKVASLTASKHNILNESYATPQYSISKYSRSFHLINFHSWIPYASDPDYSLSFVSENILNTLQSEVFFAYNRNEAYKQVGVNTVYGGLFPFLNIGFDYTFDRNGRFRNTRVFWNEAEVSAGFSVPLNLTAGKIFTNLLFGSEYVYNKQSFQGIYKDTFDSRGFGYLNSSIRFSHQVQQARQHIFPRVAQNITLNYKNAVSNREGRQFLGTGNLYFPGFHITHNIVLNAAFHKRDTLSNIGFSNSFPFARGYRAENFYRMWKIGGNYHFPLVYPDWGFGNIVYFMRIRANLFYDHSRIADYNKSGKLVKLNFRSFGTEIFFDTKWWNQQPISFGFRYSRLLNTDFLKYTFLFDSRFKFEIRSPNQFEFILPVNLFNR